MRKFTEAIHDAMSSWLSSDPDFSIFGLGASYPNGLDGTAGQLASVYPERLLDVPASESSVTGLALGRAVSGKRTLVHHGRSEFAMFAADQIFTQAAKWRYQFGGDQSVSLTIRVALGRQWGNGSQHSASYLQAFSSVPGLRVFLPSSPNSAFRQLCLAIELGDPVAFLEPRWLYQVKQEASQDSLPASLDCEYEVVKEGSSIAIVSYGEGVLDSVLASARFPAGELAIFDYWNLTPAVGPKLLDKLEGFPVVLFVDPYCSTGGPMTEIASQLATRNFRGRLSILRIPNTPAPHPTSLAEIYYLNESSIAKRIAELMEMNIQLKPLNFDELHLPPRIELTENWEIVS